MGAWYRGATTRPKRFTCKHKVHKPQPLYKGIRVPTLIAGLIGQDRILAPPRPVEDGSGDGPDGSSSSGDGTTSAEDGDGDDPGPTSTAMGVGGDPEDWR